MDTKLIERYSQTKNALSVRELAKLEREIWTTATHEEKRGGLDKVLRKLFGEGCYAYRQVLLGAGELATPLWQMIDSEPKRCSQSAGYNILRAARKIAKTQKVALRTEHVARAIDEYHSGSRVGFVGKSSRVRKRAAKNAVPDPAIKIAEDLSESKHFWSNIRDQFTQYIAPTLRSVSPDQQERTLKLVEIELSTFRAKINAVCYGAVSAAPTRAQLVQAYRAFGMAVPRRGESNMRQVRRKFHFLSREYHPDATGGNARKTEIFQQLVNAFEVIQRYHVTAGDSGRHQTTAS